MDLKNEYGTLAVQQECVELLKSFHSFCADNEIAYSIAYGTLLGAVRHKGFIPWDDDIDVIMDRKNYEKFLSIVHNVPSFSLERMTKHALWVDKLYFSDSADNRTPSPNIDLFVMDHSPDRKVVYKFKLFIIYMLQGMMKYSLPHKGTTLQKIYSVITFVIGRPFSHRRKYIWYHKVSQWGNARSTLYEQCYNTLFNYISCRFKSGLLNDVALTPFEDLVVYAIKDYDSFLTAQYGDYMTPPPVKDRVPEHMNNDQ